MGSVVFPKGTLRFLTAKPEIRAKRRFKQLIEKEIPCTLNDIFQDITEEIEVTIIGRWHPLRLRKKERH